MATITKDLGIATAYGYAKSNGYTGTEEEFAELMASYASVAEEAAQSASNAGVSERNAAGSASAAAGSASSAAQSATSASGSATSAAESASTASAKASEAAQSATAAAGSAASASEDAGTASTAATAAEQSATAAAGSATSAGQSATAAAGSAQAAQDVLDSIPADYSELSGDVSNLKSAIDDAPREETGAELLEEETERTILEEYFLDTLDRIFTNLPQDDAAGGILAELEQENLWLDMLQRELEARESA